MKYTILVSVLISFFIFSCQTEPKQKANKVDLAGLESLDLMQYSVPISIKAPKDVQIKKGNLGFSKDISIEKGKYNIYILINDATTTDKKALKASLLNDVKEGGLFHELLKEEDNGFIYSTKIDDFVSHDFRYVYIQGDKEYTFSAGLMGQFSQEEVEKMYQAVQQ